MLLRNIIIGIVICIFFLALLPLLLYMVGVNILPGNTTTPVSQKTSITKEELGVLIRSEDGGSTWNNAARSEDPAVGFPGTIYSFVIHPKDSNIMYLGGAHSGLWKSGNAGRTWNQMIDKSYVLDANADVYDIEIENANSDVIYVAAFENNHGMVLESQDGGDHFIQRYATSADKTTLSGIAIDPAKNDHLLAITGEGALIETVNGGQTWRVKKSFTKPLIRLIADPGSIQNLYVINADGDVFKSVTGGNDWSDSIGKSSSEIGPLTYPPQVFNFFGSNKDGSQTVFMLDPSDSSNVYLGQSKSLLRSQDAGLTWHEINLLFSKELLPVTAVAVDPHTSSTIFVAAANELQESTDDGATWRNVPLPAGIHIKRLIIHPQSSNVMFAIVSSR